MAQTLVLLISYDKHPSKTLFLPWSVRERTESEQKMNLLDITESIN